LPIGRDPESGLFEFAHVGTGELAERGPDGRLTITEDTGLVFVLIPGGALQMGAQSTDPTGPNYDPLARSDEAPVHEVQLEPFFLSKYQMNQGQWLRIAGANPSAHAPGSPTLGRPFTLLHPVEQVSFDDCEPMLARFELLVPTEAQWEWAARGGTTTRWWTGSDRESLVGACNLADQAAWRAGATWEACKDWPELDDGWPLHAPVTEFRPNPFGLHGTVGNVWEWTRCFAGSYTVPQRPGDGYREEFGSDPELRVTRGASFGNVSAWARVTYRNLVKRDVRGNYIGVRPARALEQ
jgi:formylglycine-generating enzyme required for sulfatase activity